MGRREGQLAIPSIFLIIRGLMVDVGSVDIYTKRPCALGHDAHPQHGFCATHGAVRPPRNRTQVRRRGTSTGSRAVSRHNILLLRAPHNRLRRPHALPLVSFPFLFRPIHYIKTKAAHPPPRAPAPDLPRLILAGRPLGRLRWIRQLPTRMGRPDWEVYRHPPRARWPRLSCGVECGLEVAG